MVLVNLKHVKAYRSNGRTYWYHRVTKERLPDDETKRIARVAEINATLEGWRENTIPGSLGDIISRYKASPEFRQELAPSTRKRYLELLDWLERTAPQAPIVDINVAWLYDVRDRMANTPRTANMMLAVLSVLLNFSIARGFRQDNPVQHVKKLGGAKNFETWPDEIIDLFRAKANPRIVWAMELALFTGQRRGDILAMRWNHIEGEGKDATIAVAQQKTGERLFIPIHKHLASVLSGIPRKGVFIVAREDGKPYTGSGFASNFQREKRRLGVRGLQFHGLRHTAAARLADAGCTDREIMSILGHRTASMVTRYTRGADQKRLARSAMLKASEPIPLSKHSARSV